MVLEGIVMLSPCYPGFKIHGPLSLESSQIAPHSPRPRQKEKQGHVKIPQTCDETCGGFYKWGNPQYIAGWFHGKSRSLIAG
jgi:hypothetical protein